MMPCKAGRLHLVGERNISVRGIRRWQSGALLRLTFYKAPGQRRGVGGLSDTKAIHPQRDITLREGIDVTANDANVRRRYTLKGERNVSVTVDADGTATPLPSYSPIRHRCRSLWLSFTADEAGADISDSITAS